MEHALHSPLFWTYAAIGPGLWAIALFGLVTAHVKLGKLRASEAKLRASPPEVTVLIPAHNEAVAIEPCLRSVLAMDYPSFRVVAINDRSRDATGQVMDRMAASDPRLTILHLTDRPPGWLGKCYALHAGGTGGGAAGTPPAAAISSPWILFVDSDVVVQPNALSKVIAIAQARDFAAISVLTRQRCETFLERLLTPVACGAILAMYAASVTNDDNRRNTAFANGQFFLIRADVYRKAGGHESVRQDGCEDVALMRRMKKLEVKCRLYSGDDLAETRMYTSVRDMFKGWARIYSTASYRRPWRILLASGFVMSGMLSFAAIAFVPAHPAYALAVAAHVALVITSIGAVYRWSRNSPFLALLFPLAGAMQLAFYANALYWCATKRFEWRGQSYAPLVKPADIG